METAIFQDDFGYDLHYQIYHPDETPIGLIQILHGLGQHSGHYQELCTYMQNAGFLVIIHDQHGHGKSAIYEDRTHVSDHDGHKILVEGAKGVRSIVKSKYPQLPMFAIGHSLGSIIVRAAITTEKDLYDASVFIGSPKVSRVKLKAIKTLAKNIKRFKAPNHISQRFTKLVQDAPYRSMRKNGLVNERYEWVTSDVEKQRAYKNDPLAGNMPTIAMQLDIIHLLEMAQNKNASKQHASSQPISIICGDEDAMCDYGEGIKKLHKFYTSVGYSNVSFKVYANARHELLNETIRDNVMKDLLSHIKTALIP